MLNNKPFGKLLHSKFLDYPQSIGESFDESITEYISDTIVMHLNSRVRFAVHSILVVALADVIHKKLSEEIGSDAI